MPAQWTADVIGEMHIKGLTQKDLAKHLGVSHEYVNKVLKGKREPRGAEEKFRNALKEMGA